MKRTRRRFSIRTTGPATREAVEIEVDVTDETRVLDVLETIRLEHDPDLVYRRSCHHGSCGTCTCTIDGRPRLACTTRVAELSGDPVVIAPLDGFASVGGLAVDRRSLFRELDPNWSILRPSETPGADDNGQESSPLRFENCIECGACVAACPAAFPPEGFMGPAGLAALHRELQKRPQAEPSLLEIAARPRGAAACRRALECSRVCPAAVYPARHIADLQRRLTKHSPP